MSGMRGGFRKRELRWNGDPTPQSKGRGSKPSTYGCARRISTRQRRLTASAALPLSAALADRGWASVGSLYNSATATRRKWRIMYWNRGAQILIREHWNNKVWTVQPVTVVADTADVIALYMMPGTIYKHPRQSTGVQCPTFCQTSGYWSTGGGGAVVLCIWHRQGNGM